MDIQKSFTEVANVDQICDVGVIGRTIIENTDFKSQSNYNHRRGRRIANIINDMFSHEDFRGKEILELGPGHYAFALLARSLGARVVCIENDPAFAKLGRHLGFEIYERNFFDLTEIQLSEKFDGLFVKGTFNACDAPDREFIDEFVKRYNSILKPDGWGWFVTANKMNEISNGDIDGFVEDRIEMQKSAFVFNGWQSQRIPENFDSPRYAINYSGSKYLFTKNLQYKIGS